MEKNITEKQDIIPTIQEEILIKTRKTDDPEYFKKYYNNNRQKLLTKAKTLTKCTECHKVLSAGHLKRHKLSRDHLKAIEANK